MDIENRVAVLEQEVARLRRSAQLTCSLAVLLGTVAFGMLAAAPAISEEDHRKVVSPFTIVNSHGRPLLRVSELNGKGVLSVHNANGQARVALTATDTAGTVLLSSDSFLNTLMSDQNGASLRLLRKKPVGEAPAAGGIVLEGGSEKNCVTIVRSDGKSAMTLAPPSSGAGSCDDPSCEIDPTKP